MRTSIERRSVSGLRIDLSHGLGQRCAECFRRQAGARDEEIVADENLAVGEVDRARGVRFRQSRLLHRTTTPTIV